MIVYRMFQGIDLYFLQHDQSLLAILLVDDAYKICFTVVNIKDYKEKWGAEDTNKSTEYVK